ncbi:MAG: SDR family oxidoreductase [Roseovarius sp.]
MDFEGKTVLITGAASGFGKLLAETLSARGARLVLGDVNEAGLTALAETLGPEAAALPCDVAREADVAALTETALTRFGRLDIAVNNAGIAPPMKGFLDQTEEDMDRCFAINAKGVFFGMKHQIPAMLAQGAGTILNVASVAGLNAAPKLAAYAASKHAVVGLTKTAAVEFAAKGIRINAICPFYSATPMVTASDFAERAEFLAQATPMKRLGAPEEVVAAMLALIDPASGYLTGQALAVDGGVMAL